MWAYFDTSALVKRYVDEPGRREVQQLLRRHDCVTSAILPVELRGALRRRVAERTLDSGYHEGVDLSAARAALQQARRQAIRVTPDRRHDAA